MRWLWGIFLIAGCGEIVMPEPTLYPASCPVWDAACERRFDAQTLSIIGQPDAALELLCLGSGVGGLSQCGASSSQ